MRKGRVSKEPRQNTKFHRGGEEKIIVIAQKSQGKRGVGKERKGWGGERDKSEGIAGDKTIRGPHPFLTRGAA